MKKKRYFLLLTLLSFAFVFEAKEVSYDEALQTASEFFAPASSSKKQVKALKSNLSLATTFNQTEAEKPAFYVINNGEKGFVIVSADDNAKQILAYSEEGAFDANNIPSNVKFWLNRYVQEISYVVKNGIEKPLYATATTYKPIEPLLGNIEHNQSEPYNNICPLKDGERTVTGCAATAAAQIMTYYKYPAKGTGEVSYTWEKNNNQTLSADLSQSTYNWDNILDKYETHWEYDNDGNNPTEIEDYTEEQAEAVAQLLKDVGYASEMEYGTSDDGGSGTSDQKVAAAMVNNFSYDKSLHRSCFNASSDDGEGWNWQPEEDVMDEIYAELQAGRPIFFAGQDPAPKAGGHAFVCDGIQSDGKLHINWGWDGYCNAYYELTSFNPGPGGIGAGTNGRYTTDISFHTHIQKDKGTKEIPQTWGLEGLRYKLSTNQFTKTDNTDRKLFETGSQNTWIHSLNYVPTTLYFGYSIYRNTNFITASYAKWLYGTSQLLDGTEYEIGASRSWGVSVDPQIKISNLVSGVSVGAYDLYLSTVSSTNSKIGYPVYIKNRGKVKNKIAVGKTQVYIYPASESNYSRRNKPTGLKATKNGSTYTVSWSGNASSYMLLTWNDNDLKVERLSSKSKTGVADGNYWAVFSCEKSNNVIYATSDMAFGTTSKAYAPVDDITEDNLTVATNHLTIEIKAAAVSAIQIYNVLGDRLYSVQGTQASFKAPNAGVYVVQVGDKKRKVLVK